MIAATSMLTPGLWHVHEGGDGAHSHSSNGQFSDHEYSHRDHHQASRGHSHDGHQHAHHGHSHSHGGHQHAHDHTTVDGDSATKAKSLQQAASNHDGVGRSPAWHVHFSLFGFELTLQAPAPLGAVKSVIAGTTSRPRRNLHFTHPAPLAVSPAELYLSEGSGTQLLTGPRWESGPPPVKFELSGTGRSASLAVTPLQAAWRERARPPVPPPRGPIPEVSLRSGFALSQIDSWEFVKVSN